VSGVKEHATAPDARPENWGLIFQKLTDVRESLCLFRNTIS